MSGNRIQNLDRRRTGLLEAKWFHPSPFTSIFPEPRSWLCLQGRAHRRWPEDEKIMKHDAASQQSQYNPSGFNLPIRSGSKCKYLLLFILVLLPLHPFLNAKTVATCRFWYNFEILLKHVHFLQCYTCIPGNFIGRDCTFNRTSTLIA